MRIAVSKYKIWGAKTTATMAVSMVLFLFGLLVFFLIVGQTISTQVKERFAATLMITDASTQKEIDDLYKEVNGLPYVKSVKYISKEKALKELERELGEDPISFIGYNPLSASMEVRLDGAYNGQEAMGKLVERLKGDPHISEIHFPKQMIDKVNANLGKLAFVAMGLALLLTLISYALISNTIQLLVYAERFKIQTMEYVGATKWFICAPYFKMGMGMGVVAALLAFVYLVVLYELAFADIYFIDFVDWQTGAIVLGSMIFVGALFTSISAKTAVGHYIGRKEEELHYM